MTYDGCGQAVFSHLTPSSAATWQLCKKQPLKITGHINSVLISSPLHVQFQYSQMEYWGSTGPC